MGAKDFALVILGGAVLYVLYKQMILHQTVYSAQPNTSNTNAAVGGRQSEVAASIFDDILQLINTGVKAATNQTASTSPSRL
jgi:hypothetical protein